MAAIIMLPVVFLKICFIPCAQKNVCGMTQTGFEFDLPQRRVLALRHAACAFKIGEELFEFVLEF